MTFGDLQARLVAAIRTHIRNGELTERGLARLVGASQPHIHNVLKGARTLSLEMSDRILEGLGLTVLDLLGEAAPAAALSAPRSKQPLRGTYRAPPPPSAAS